MLNDYLPEAADTEEEVESAAPVSAPEPEPQKGDEPAEGSTILSKKEKERIKKEKEKVRI